MYYSHFGLTQAPFKITPNTEFFFGGGNRGPVLEALIYAISHGEGIIKVSGEVGSGKTMLCHMLQTRLPAHILTVYVPNPSVSPDEILRAIAFELQLDVASDTPRLAVMQALHEFLLKRYAEGKRVVVFVEESQSMPVATLEEIRLLSNLETRNDKLLQIVLFGQPELDHNLAQANIRQLRERITHSFRLEPLAAGEIREYLMFRMRTAGYRGPDLFSPSVVKYIARASQGLTRRVNIIADKALLAAFSENTHSLRQKHVAAAVRDSEFSQQPGKRIQPRYWWGAALLAAGALLGITLYVLVQQSVGEATVAAATPPKAAVAERSVATQQTGGPATSPAPAPEAAPRSTPAPTEPLAQTRAGTASAPAIREKAAKEPPVPEPQTAAASVIVDTKSKSPLTAASVAGDPLEARLAATREWLGSEPESTYSIQIMGTEDATQLKHHLNVLSKSIEMNKIFVYRTIAKEKPSLTVLYGSFSDRQAAQQALKELPSSIKAFRPLLRTVQGIQGEIRRHHATEEIGSARS